MGNDLKPVEKRLEKARQWSKRIDSLLKNRRKTDPEYSEADFCRKHNFDYGFFNRSKNMKTVPHQKTVDLIEAALKEERV